MQLMLLASQDYSRKSSIKMLTINFNALFKNNTTGGKNDSPLSLGIIQDFEYYVFVYLGVSETYKFT